MDTDEFADEETGPRIPNSEPENVRLGETVGSLQIPVVNTLSKEERKLLEENPHFHSIMSKMLDAKLQVLLPQGQGTKGLRNDQNQFSQNMKQVQIDRNEVSKAKTIKSPSDTTIYAPALAKQTNEINSVQCLERHVSDFVGAIRKETESIETDRVDDAVPSTSKRQQQQSFAKENEKLYMIQEARSKAENDIQEAENYKVAIVTLTGINDVLLNQNNTNVLADE